MNTRPALPPQFERESCAGTVGAGLVPARRAPNRQIACADATRAGTSPAPTKRPRKSSVEIKLALIAFVLVAACVPAVAQKSAADAARRKLPSADKVIADYLKAAGGKRRLAAIVDATYEWSVVGDGGAAGAATSQVKAPASFRLSVTRPGGEFSEGVTTRVAWTRAADGSVHTLTGAEAKRARDCARRSKPRASSISRSRTCWR